MLQDMNALEHVFSMGSSLAMLGWLILLLLPRKIKVLWLIPSLLIPLLLSFAYGGLIMAAFYQGDGGNFSSLAGVKQLVSNDAALLAGWFHWLAFDLFIGCVIAKKADAVGIHRVIQAPFLFLTFMAGPLGFFLFYCVYGGVLGWHKFGSQDRPAA